MDAGGGCGMCHDGKQAFGILDSGECRTCHPGDAATRRDSSRVPGLRRAARRPPRAGTARLAPQRVLPRDRHVPARDHLVGARRLRGMPPEAVQDDVRCRAARWRDARALRVRRLPRRAEGLRHRRPRRLFALPRRGGGAAVSHGMLFDSTRCIGCGACSAACKEQNGLPLQIEERTTRLHLDRRRAPGRGERAPALHALPHADLRLGVPGRRHEEEDGGGAGGLRLQALHRVPLLHHGVPVRGPEVPSGTGRSRWWASA